MSPTPVVSQGLAEELRANGWPQEGSAFYWIKAPQDDYPYAWELERLSEGSVKVCEEEGFEAVAAPLASELMERMPEYVYFQKQGKVWCCCLQNSDLDTIPTETAATLPDACAKMLIHLIQQGIVKV